MYIRLTTWLSQTQGTQDNWNSRKSHDDSAYFRFTNLRCFEKLVLNFVW